MSENECEVSLDPCVSMDEAKRSTNDRREIALKFATVTRCQCRFRWEATLCGTC